MIAHEVFVIQAVVVGLFIVFANFYGFWISGRQREERELRIRDHGPPRVLDEMAAAFHELNGKPGERIVATSLSLVEQFRVPLSPDRWHWLETWLGCQLPALTPNDEGWTVPDDWESVADLAYTVARQRPEWAAPPPAMTLRDWREAQIFVIVRQIVSEQLSIPYEEIGRSDRFVEDLYVD